MLLYLWCCSGVEVLGRERGFGCGVCCCLGAGPDTTRVTVEWKTAGSGSGLNHCKRNKAQISSTVYRSLLRQHPDWKKPMHATDTWFHRATKHPYKYLTKTQISHKKHSQKLGEITIFTYYYSFYYILNEFLLIYFPFNWKVVSLSWHFNLFLTCLYSIYYFFILVLVLVTLALQVKLSNNWFWFWF